MTSTGSYVLDSDVFITAKNNYYAFAICPGFWASLLGHHESAQIFSIDRVRDELLLGRKTEDLVLWVRNEVPDSFFRSTAEETVAEAFGDIMLWAQRHVQFSDEAKAKFATGADGWLVAYSMVHQLAVITNEQPSPQSRSAIKLPDVCREFGVRSHGTFEMLTDLGVAYTWTGTG